MTKHTCEYCKYCKQCSSLEKRLTKKGELCYDFENKEEEIEDDRNGRN